VPRILIGTGSPEKSPDYAPSMKSPLLNLLVTGALVCWSGVLPAETKDKAEPDLDALAAQVKKARETDYSQVIAELDKAAATPQAAQSFFFECVQKMDFKRDLDVPAKFENWKRDFMAQWRGHELGVVLQMQLQYQSLVLRSAVDREARANLVPQWLHFVEAIVDHAKEAAYGAAFLAQPINASIFNKALKLQQMAGMEGFNVGAMDIGRIFDIYIHPYVKKENRSSAWQRHIDLQKRFSEAVLLPSELDDFDNYELPRLQFRGLMDVKFSDGERDPAAVKEVAQFIQQHIHHPDAKQWVEALKAVTSK
jgi:hypothetical protein